MAVVLGVTDGYATLVEANAYNIASTAWEKATDAVKQDALMFARYYIDDNWVYDLEQIDAIDEEMKLGNSILALDYLENGKLFGDSEAPIKSKSVSAGAVSQSITYDVSINYKPPSIGKAFAIIAKVAIKRTGTAVSLIRA